MHSDKAKEMLDRLDALTPKQRVIWEVATSKLFKKKIAKLLKQADATTAIQRLGGFCIGWFTQLDWTFLL